MRRLAALRLPPVLLGLALVVGGCSTDASPEEPGATSSTAAPAERRDVTDADFGAIRTLLDARATAVVEGDREAFLATVDPEGDDSLTGGQETFFDNLQDLDVERLYYGLVDTGLVPDEVDGGEAVVRPELFEHVQLQGINQRPVANQVSITFVARGGGWYVGNEKLDETFEAQSRPWFGARIQAASARDLLVLTDEGATVSADYLLDVTQTALGRVVDTLGVPVTRPLLVDATTNGLTTEVSNASGQDAAAVAFATYAADRTGQEAGGRAGSVVKANPEQVSYLVEDDCVLRHELTHYVLDPGYYAEQPQWASEGIADYVCYQPYLMPDGFYLTDDARKRIEAREVALIVPGRWGDDPEVDYLVANSFAQFLVETYGMPKYLEMLRTFVRYGREKYGYVPRGDGIEGEVLGQVYGTTPTAVARGGYALLRAIED